MIGRPPARFAANVVATTWGILNHGHMSTNHTLGVCMYASNPLRVFLASQDAPLISSALETLPETQLRELRPPIGPGPKIIILQGRFRPQKILCVAVSNDEKKMSCLFLSAQTCEKKIDP